RKRILAEALAAGAEYVDIESNARFDALLASTGGKRVVLSTHDFKGVPDDLEARVHAMQATGADVVKIAVTTKRLRDCVTLLDAGSRARRADALVLVGMGEHGMATRVLPSRFRSKWSYAGALAGIGQLTPDALASEFRFRDVDADTAFYGLVGSPVSHSVSPAMHNAAFRASGIDAVYLPLPAVDVDDFVVFSRSLGIKGASIRTSYKLRLFVRVD